jgi:hypothetical protein
MISACVQNPVKLPSRAEAEQFVKDYQKATKHAMNAKVVYEFREIFPTKMITLSSYRIPSVKQSLVVETSLYSKYEFRLGMDVEFDKSWVEVVRFGEPLFQLDVVLAVEQLEDGRFSVSYTEGSQRRFGEQEWKKLYEARGDFSVLGISLRKDQPVPLFDEYWKAQESRFAANLCDRETSNKKQ